MHCIKVADNTFDQEVLEEKKLVLVDFWAKWCGPCRTIAPVLESLAEEMVNTLKVCKVDIDENPESPTKFGVRSIPTLCLFKEGQLISTKAGALPKNILVEWIQKNS